MINNLNYGWTYDDVSYFSREISEITSRTSSQLDLNLSYKIGDIEIDRIPIIASPMLDVCGGDMLNFLNHNNAFAGVYHGIQTHEEWQHDLELLLSGGHLKTFCFAVSLKDYEERLKFFKELASEYSTIPPVIICVDVANGSSKLLEEPLKFINKFKFETKDYLNLSIMTGNIVTKEAAKWLYNLGVQYLRIGIGTGSICSTPIETGVFRPPLTAINEIYEWKKQNWIDDVYLIADGGMNSVSNFMKAFAFGADLVMCGRLLAGWDISNGPEIIEDLGGGDIKIWKKYRGSASKEIAQIRNEINNNINKKIIIEGVTDYIEYKGDDNDLYNFWKQIIGSMGSALSYTNAKDINEFRENVEIVINSRNSHEMQHPYNKQNSFHQIVNL